MSGPFGTFWSPLAVRSSLFNHFGRIEAFIIVKFQFTKRRLELGQLKKESWEKWKPEQQ